MKTIEIPTKSDLRLANLLYQDNKLSEARLIYEEIITVAPHHMKSLDRLQRIAFKEKRYADALALSEKLMSLMPYPQVSHYLQLGQTLNKLRRVEDSLSVHKKAIKLNPFSAKTYHKLAHVYRTNGRLLEAEQAYENVFALDPTYVNSYYPYSSIHTFSKNDPVIALVERLLENPNTHGHKKVRLLYTMGKIQDDLKNYSEAFACYKQANDQIVKDMPFNSQAHSGEIRDLINFWNSTPTLPSSLEPTMTHIPIFIIGLSRSGKSITEWMLSEHPEIISGGEGNEWYSAINTVFPLESRKEWIANTLRKLTDEQKAEIGWIFQKNTAKHCPPSPYIIHSMPSGYWYVGLLLEIFPKAKLIHCTRDTMDNIWISYCKLYRNKNSYSYNLKCLYQFALSYLQLMDHWKSLYGSRILTVKYEDTCRNPENELRRILKFCEIDYKEPPQFPFSQDGIGKHLPYKEMIEAEINK